MTRFGNKSESHESASNHRWRSLCVRASVKAEQTSSNEQKRDFEHECMPAAEPPVCLNHSQ